MAKIIIIGGGGAGIAAAQAAREHDAAAEISLICAEKRLPYYRPRICEVLGGSSADTLIVKPKAWFDEMRIKLVFAEVGEIIPAVQEIVLQDKSRLSYDTLVIATGANANIPAVEGVGQDGVTVFRTMAQVEAVKDDPGPVMIIGGGLLALEAAGELAQSGRKVMVADRNPQLLSRQLDRQAGAFLAGLVQKAGIEPLFEASLAAIEGQRPNFKVRFKDGRSFDCGLVVFAAGISSEFRLAAAAGIACAKAIIIDNACRSSLPHIYAAGDCAELDGKIGGLWSVAQAQGYVAGANAAGAAQTYSHPIPSYVMDAMGLHLASCGDIKAEDTAIRSFNQEFLKLFFREDKLAGAIEIGNPVWQAQLKKGIDEGMTKESALALTGFMGAAAPSAAPQVYICSVCGYALDLAVGDKTIAPGTAWEDVPANWRCPICGAGKEFFHKAE